jgi:hypothetical protein
MICNKCKNEISDKLSVCPLCGNKVKKVYKSGFVINNKENNDGAQKSFSFISMKRPTKGKEIDRRKFVNYLDYKDAKDKQDDFIKGNIEFKNKFISIDSKNDVSATNGKLKNKKKNSKVVRTKNFSSAIARQASIDNINNVIYKPNKKKMNGLVFLGYAMVVIIWVAVFVLVSGDKNDYYFEEDQTKNTIATGDNSKENTKIDEELSNYTPVSKSGQVNKIASEGVTSIVYDNQYLKQFNIDNYDTVKRLLITDSVKQKDHCLKEITNIENEIINNYGIVAVNLCEMDIEFAKELSSVVAYIYNTYPNARNYLTNLTLANVDNVSYMAAFMPVFTFATSKTTTGYPVAIKTQIILNAKYFLNVPKIENSVSYGTKTGYFPSGATRSSAVAHEFGHYLSYVALLNHYDSGALNFVKASNASLLYDVYTDFNEGKYVYELLKEAYDLYQSYYHSDYTFDQWRGTISKYAVSKDNNGLYIYDETVAEAFHDCYINGELAEPASRMIMHVLESKL